jgi:hypothetical protein
MRTAARRIRQAPGVREIGEHILAIHEYTS